MPPAVVDTDVVSFLFRRDSRAELYRPHLTGRLLVVSFMTVAELDRWALERNWGEARRQKMEQHLTNFVVYPFDRALCRRWAEASDGARRAGRPIGVADAWIAATALLYDIPLVTHNRDHYWDSPASADTLTLRDASFLYSNLLEGGGTPVAQSRVQPAGVVEAFQILEDRRLRRLPCREVPPTH